MTFTPHALQGTIREYIETIFHFKDFMPDHSIERVVPTGHIFIIFELDGFTRSTYHNESLKPKETFTQVWISGMHKNYISISAHQKSEMFVIQFKPQGAYPFLRIPIDELNEKVVPAEKVFGQEIIDLRKEIIAKKTPLEKFELAESWLNNLFSKDRVPPTEFLQVLSKLQAQPISDYGKIISSYSKTQKHLISQFKKYVGLTPKYYQRVLRFNEILQQIHQSEKIEWSQIAYQCEYSDQSHFIKEFKHFSGINPQKFIQQNFHNDPTNFFPLDREG